VALEWGLSQPIPVHFSLADTITWNAQRRAAPADARLVHLLDLAAMDDGIANVRTSPAMVGRSHCRCSPRRGWTIRYRLRQCTGTAPEHFQNFVLFTNYQFYIDECIRLGREQMAAKKSDYATFVEPGDVITRRAGTHPLPGDELGVAPNRLPQMPAYHLVRPDRSGITMVNIGVGPANAKNISDHVAVLRPHAWLMLGHCAGLRNTQQLGDYVLAYGYVREDHVLDEELPLWVPIPPLAEFSGAGASRGRRDPAPGLRVEACAARHGGVHRQPGGLLPHPGPERRFSQSRAIAGTWRALPSRANGFAACRWRAAVRERQTAGNRVLSMANQFYPPRVDQHLRTSCVRLVLHRLRLDICTAQAAQLLSRVSVADSPAAPVPAKGVFSARASRRAYWCPVRSSAAARD
jgi:AMP nucleosidase